MLDSENKNKKLFLKACFEGEYEIVSNFLKNGVTPNLKIKNELAPLNQAISGYFNRQMENLSVSEELVLKYSKTIKLLLKNGSSLEVDVVNDIAPLQHALEEYFVTLNRSQGVFSIFEKVDLRPLIHLIEYGAPVNGYTSLIRCKFNNDYNNCRKEELVFKGDYEELIKMLKMTKRLCLRCDAEIKTVKRLFRLFKKCETCGFATY